MSTIFGIPLHPLVVHAAVVLVPLAASALIATGWRKEWRRTYGLPIALLALAGAAAAILASQTGESLQETIRDAARAAGTRANFGDHPEEGDTARIFAVLFGLAALGVWAAERWYEELRLQAWAIKGAYVVSSGLGVAAIATMVIAGHSGAVLVWKDIGTYVSRR